MKILAICMHALHKNIILYDKTFQMTPSQFMFDMQMDTDQKLANTHTMNIPKKVELLDMADTSLQKVHFLIVMLDLTYYETDCLFLAVSASDNG